MITMRPFVEDLERVLPRLNPNHKNFVTMRMVASMKAGGKTTGFSVAHCTAMADGTLKAKGFSFKNPMPKGLYRAVDGETLPTALADRYTINPDTLNTHSNWGGSGSGSSGAHRYGI